MAFADLTADPTELSTSMTGWITTDPSVRFTSVHETKPLTPRTTQVITLSAPEPVISQGKPIMPKYRVVAPVKVTGKEGPTHIRTRTNPAPVWNPATGTWQYPPGLGGVGTYRWVVATLLPPTDDPASKYLLGTPSANDETLNIDELKTGWYPDKSTGGPIWHAEYPFKPTVFKRVSHNGSATITHPVGVHFSSDNASHMWLDMGVSKPQPITWIIVAIPTRRFVKPLPIKQVILEAGRSAYQVGVPQKTPAQIGQADIVVNEGLSYHTMLATSGNNIQMSTLPTSGSIVAPNMSGVRPMFFCTVFNGANSVLYARDNLHKSRVIGAVKGGAAYQHRYYVLGRNFGHINDINGQEMVVFEMRYWDRALTDEEIESQYAELSSTYLFSRYKK